MEYLEFFDKEKKHKIETKVADSKDVSVWQKEVMPFEKSEVAKDWNWEQNRFFLVPASKLAKQKPEFITLKKDGVPVAMMLYAKEFREQVTTGVPQPTGFIWYVQKAPKEYLEKNNITEKKFDVKIATAILDTAVTLSLNGLPGGNVLLHADPKGGDFLLDFYSKQGFKKIPLEAGERISVTRANDGRYFHMTPRDSLNYTHKNRQSIGQSHTKGFEISQERVKNSIPILDLDQEKKSERITMEDMAKLPYEERVAKEIIDALEKGTAPWTKPWKGEDLSRMAPFNPTTGKQYKGMNFVNLSMKTALTGDPRWMTYKQAKTLGGQVRKGEKGTLIQHWKFSEQIDKLDENGKKVIGEDGKVEKVTVKLEHPKRFFATVFNGSQIDNLPELDKDLEEKEQLTDFSPIEAAEEILKNSGAEIHHRDGNRAFYAPGRDEIVLPHKEQFKSEMGYYSTALHELGHWTGHESRLDRDLSNSFGSVGYAKEELRAEIGSFMLSSQIGIDFNPDNHVAYVASWVKILEDTPKEIFKASSDAGKIVQFVTGLQHEQAQTQTQTETLSKEAVELGYMYPPKDLAAAQNLTNSLEWDDFTEGAKIEQIIGIPALKEATLDYADVMKDAALKEYVEPLAPEPIPAWDAVERHFKTLVANAEDQKEYKPFIDPQEVKNGLDHSHSSVLEQVGSQDKYHRVEAELIDTVIEYIGGEYPMDHALVAEALNERFNTMFKEEDIRSIEAVYPQWVQERSETNDPELTMKDIRSMEDKYMTEQQIPDKPISKVAETVIDKLSKGSIATKLNTTDAKHLIEMYGSVQAQSGYGFTHTELDFGAEGKYMLLQREDKGEITSTVSNRNEWSKDHFVSKGDVLQKDITALFEQGTPYELSDGTVLMGHLSGGEVNNIKSEGIYIFTGEPGNMVPTTKLSNDEAKKMIDEDLAKIPVSELNTTRDGSLVVEDRSEMRSHEKNLLLIEIRKALNEGKRGDDLSTFIKPMAEFKDTPLEEISKAIDWTKDNLKNRGNEGTIGETLNTLENTLEEVYQAKANSHTALQTFMKEIKDLNQNHLATVTNENLDEVLKDRDKVFEQSTLWITDGEGNFEDAAKTMETVEDLRNAAIWGQGEMLKGDLPDHVYTVVSANVEAFKKLADNLEAEMMKEPNLAEQIKENAKKLEERDAKITKDDKAAVFEEKTYLAVPYEKHKTQINAAKKAGARWDKEAKSWYAPPGASKEKLRDWIIENKEIKALTEEKPQAQDPVAEFKAALEERGLIIDGDPVMDGKMQRVKVQGDKGRQKSGAYVGYSDGRPAGMIQNFKTGLKENWKSMDTSFSNNLTPEKIAEQKALNEAKEAQRAKEMEELNETVSEKVTKEYASLPSATEDHAYLKAKGVKSHGLKLDERSNLVMPIKDIDGKQWSAQRINTNFKGLEKGGKKTGNFHLIGADNLKDTKEVIIVEGYATGATVHEATGTPVVVAIDGGNLKPVAEAIRDKYPDKPILIAGDNDIQRELAGKDNVGKIKATEAAETSKSFAIIPQFSNTEIKDGATDFNDMAKHRGPKEIKRIINNAMQHAKSKAQEIQKQQSKSQNMDQHKKNQREVIRKQSIGMSR
jgi:antirestriction protein ArdC/phage/plasmid primase-like uncharacterized protein